MTRGDLPDRDVDDIGDAVLSYAEVKGLATGNPLVIEQAGVQAELAKLERLARAHRDEQHRLERTAEQARAEAAHRRADASRYDAAIARRIDTSGDRFTMDVDGRRHTKRVDAGQDLTRELRRALGHFATVAADDTSSPPAPWAASAASPSASATGSASPAKPAERLALDPDGHGPELRLRPDDLDDKRSDTVITQLEGRLRLETERDRAIADAEDQQRRASEAEPCTGQPFPEQHRLDELRHRYQQIVDDLNAKADGDPTAGEPSHTEHRADLPDLLPAPVACAAVEPLGLD